MNLILKIFIPHQVLAASNWSGRCYNNNFDFATIQGFECLFANIIQIIIPVAGLVFFAMLIIGGFQYLTAGGDPKKASAATSTLTKSVIGIVGVLLSWLILKFIQNFTGVGVTNFTLPTN